MLPLSYRQPIERRKITPLPRVCAYVWHAAFGLFSWMSHGALGIANRLLAPYGLDGLFRSILLPRERVGERSGRNRPRREALVPGTSIRTRKCTRYCCTRYCVYCARLHVRARHGIHRVKCCSSTDIHRTLDTGNPAVHAGVRKPLCPKF